MPSTGAISLAEIMSHHRDLLVHPICWTSRHLEMLGCRFEHIDHAPTYDIEPEANTCQPVDNGKVLEEQAETNLFHEEGFAEGSFSLCPDLDFGCLRVLSLS
ncbi:hypothetical protein N7519_007112 [Penicillium mononematosum]|uniref:uncharacterized protein n=1 Tax=Penicillium mononematosum TaxID=268346 RepID=UPI0025473C1A|nr:uncharacterized protein N7519_007112 [Penicillium mononematosum]KAJ6185811.1 hypothetical protein N7519_007112 [Penicillium mononematosum]